MTRVAPLPQLARGRHQFFSDKANLSNRRKKATGWYYIFLKFLSALVYFGVPVFGLERAAANYRGSELEGFWWGLLAWTFVTGAASALLILVINDVKLVTEAWKAITNERKSETHPETSPPG